MPSSETERARAGGNREWAVTGGDRKGEDSKLWKTHCAFLESEDRMVVKGEGEEEEAGRTRLFFLPC